MRPIDEEHLMEKVSRMIDYCEKNKDKKFNALDILFQVGDAIMDCPTLDVVPRAEVARLQGVLLQFTDIAHKWGAKNNIDTSEISLVPILQEEADSIIKNANQEYAREIFEEIKNLCSLHHEFNGTQIVAHIDFKKLAELKKKYTEDGK